MQLWPVFPLLGSSLRHGSRTVLVLGALIGAAPAATAGEAGTPVLAEVTGLRSTKGVVRACLTLHPDQFLQCRDGPGSYSLVVPAAETVRLDFGRVAPGRYAIALLHDENNNGKADRALMMMPKEGFGFSRDAPVRFGPPRFARAAFDVGDEPVTHIIRMRYML